VTQSLEIPTIGIGAGPHCDGQVLVLHDILGMSPGPAARFVKTYAEVGEAIRSAAKAFASDVAEGSYPGPGHSYE
jgi:3-methyl-2-oxobutanoate hydroxymethyltransferase